MLAALREAQACCEGLQSVLQSRLAVCLPAIAEACADIVLASPHDALKHEACALLGCGLHQLHQVRPGGCTPAVGDSHVTRARVQVALDRLRQAVEE